MKVELAAEMGGHSRGVPPWAPLVSLEDIMKVELAAERGGHGVSSYDTDGYRVGDLKESRMSRSRGGHGVPPLQ